jgi:glutathione synthase/RimK-type ligase-like ATP-grasp enzyme
MQLIVVDREQDLERPSPDRLVVSAQDFIDGEQIRDLPTDVQVINRCRDVSYLSLGYHVSLLAEARGQFAEPSVEALLDLDWKQPEIEATSRHGSVAPVPRIAILHNPGERMPPSNAQALAAFIVAGRSLGVAVEPITYDDAERLVEYDALFMRETTDIDDHTYRLARKAEALGMPVIDSSQSILRCANKVYLAERMRANRVPIPRTLAITREHLGRIEKEIGFPVVIKTPDGAFSRGVHKADNRSQLEAIAKRLFEASDLILAQEFVATPFDWRVGVLNGQPLFVCQYFMAENHWQVVKYTSVGSDDYVEGNDRTLAVEDAPPDVVALGIKAADLIGDGLYGVDIKQAANGLVVVEVNDNPNIDAGVEDAVLGDELYGRIVRDFMRRIRETATMADQQGVDIKRKSVDADDCIASSDGRI